jgi:hypothetical protein
MSLESNLSSFERANYFLRPNKSVERKIVFSGIQALSEHLPISDYQYIGLGSMWFVDFVIAHKQFKIDRMFSMERAGDPYRRALFNCPYSCIEVLEGDSTDLLPSLPLAEKPSLTWMDYDTTITNTCLTDISILCEKCAPNSIVLVTLNALKGSLPRKSEAGEELTDEDALRVVAGDLVPHPLPVKRLQSKRYPFLLAEILLNQFERSLSASGRSETFVKMFEIVYVDGLPMITVGGIIAEPDKAQKMSDLAKSPKWEGIPGRTLNVPPITLLEKTLMDQLLPSLPDLDETHLVETGLALSVDHLQTYQRFYRHYPVFGEFGSF